MNDSLNRARKLMATHPLELQMLVAPGQVAMLAGNYQGALSLFDRALTTTPDVADFLDVKAECLCRMSRFEEASAIALKATACDPSYASAWVNLSWAYGGLDRYRESLDASTKALGLEGAEETIEQALTNAVVACCKLGDANMSLDIIAEYLIQHPDSTHAVKLRDAVKIEYGTG